MQLSNHRVLVSLFTRNIDDFILNETVSVDMLPSRVLTVELVSQCGDLCTLNFQSL